MDLEKLTYSEATDLLERYPAFSYAALMAMRTAPDEETRRRMRVRVAATVGSRDDLREIFGVDSESLADFYPDMQAPQLNTDDTISTFLDRFGSDRTTSASSVDDLLQGVGAAPAIDYISTIEQTLPEIPSESTQDSSRDATSESAALTESFARILIKNRNYKKALEIITELNLKNPEKSIYFADQIRFLKKLIAIENAGK